MHKTKAFIKKYWFFIAIILLIIIKQWLTCELPIHARDSEGVDQWKMLKKAEDLLNGEYWEPYTNRTMFKRDVFFPIFLSLCHLLNISYWSAISIIYTASCLLTLYSFSLYCKKKGVLLIAFITILFSPVSYCLIVQLTYNLSLVTPLSLCIISSLMIAFYYRSNTKRYLIWNLAAGIFSCILWLTREDTQWLIVLLTVYTVISFFSTRKNISRIKTWGCILFPCLLIFLGNTALCALNYAHYGVWVTNDHIATGFADAYNSLLKIAPDSYPESCSITRDMLSRAAEESPSFAELSDWINDVYEQNQGEATAGRAPDDGEIEDGWMPFILRDAAQVNGYYKDAVSADEYWKKVSHELENAFDEGRLEERNIFLFGSILKHPWVKNQNYLQKWLTSCVTLLTENIKHTNTVTELQYSTIPSDVIKRYEAMTYNNAIEAPITKLHISGWVILKTGNPFQLRLENSTGSTLCDIPLLESKDLLAFSDTYSVPLDKNRFNFSYNYESTQAENSFYLCLYNEDKVFKRIELNGKNSFDDDEILSYLEQYDNYQVNDPAETDALIKLQRLETIITVYSKAGCFMAIITAFSYMSICIISLCSVLRKTAIPIATELWLYMTAIIGSIAVYLLAYGYIDAFMFNAVGYSTPVSGLLDFLTALSIISLPTIITIWRGEKTNDNRFMFNNME